MMTFDSISSLSHDNISLFLPGQLNVEDNEDAGSRTKVRLIVPNSSCGSIIGKGGATIK